MSKLMIVTGLCIAAVAGFVLTTSVTQKPTDLDTALQDLFTAPSPDEAAAFRRHGAPKLPDTAEPVGHWFIPSPFARHVLIYQSGETSYVSTTYDDGSGSPQPAEVSAHDSGTAYKTGAADYLVVTQAGELEIWSGDQVLDIDPTPIPLASN